MDRKIMPVLGLGEGDFIIALLVSNARCLGPKRCSRLKKMVHT